MTSSPPTLETVRQAIFALYQDGDVTAKERASVWLDQFQQSPYSWQLVDQLLREDQHDLVTSYFAAQTLRTKIQFHFGQLPPDSHLSLRDSLLDHLCRLDETAHGATVTQLCLAVADLALQLPAWKDVVATLTDKFGGGAKMSTLLELLAVVPEEVHRRTLRLGANRREEIVAELSRQSGAVLTVLQSASGTGQPTQLRRVFSCLSSWLAVGALPASALSAPQPLLLAAFEVLKRPDTASDLHESATDCLCQALDTVSSSPNGAEWLFSGVLALQDSFHMCVATEDSDKLANFSRLFTELAESLMMQMVDTPGVGLGSLATLDLLMLPIGHHDYDLAAMTFNFWYRLSELIYQADNDQLTAAFRPHIERLLVALCRHCRMESDHMGIPEDNEDLTDFRSRAAECVKDVVFIVGSTQCFRQMFNLLTSVGPNASWEELEAPLHIMTAVAANIIPDEDEVLPGVVSSVLQIPPSVHICVRHTSIRLLGELKEWAEHHHTEVAEPILNFLLTTMREPKLTSVSATAIEAICCQGRDKLTALLPLLLNAVLADQQMSADAAVSLLKATATLMSGLPREEIAGRLGDLCALQARPLAAALDQPGLDPSKLIGWLDRLAAIFRHISPAVANGDVHPCLPVVKDLWPILSRTFELCQSNGRVMEHLCRCVRFVVRSLGSQSHPFLPDLVNRMVAAYNIHPHSCLLYLGSILVDEYGQFDQCIEGLANMTLAFLPPTFKVFESAGGMRNHPDSVDDFFRLGLRLVQRAPRAFLHGDLVRPLLQCAVAAVSLDHREAHQSVVKFLTELIDFVLSGRKSVAPGYPLLVAVESPLRDLGALLTQNLLVAAVFVLPSSLLRGVAEVLFALGKLDQSGLTTWLQAALQQLPTKTPAGVVSVTDAQMKEFLQAVANAKDLKSVTQQLREFCRLFR